MTKWIVKHSTGNFDFSEQPADFKVEPAGALENHFFICDCSSMPTGDYVIEFPVEQQDNFKYFPFDDGKKLWFDPFDGAVQFGEEVDHKNRRAIIYNAEQHAKRLAFMQWMLLNVWLPDKQRMFDIPQDTVALYVNQINALDDSTVARTYIKKNFYYDL